jgi:hypothetical protein
MTTRTKVQALAKYLGVLPETIDHRNGDDAFTEGRKEWLVLTDEEADEAARACILDSVWAFRPEFLAAHCVPGVGTDTIQIIQGNEKCEDNNPVLLRLIADVDRFVDDAIKADGRGHFLAQYDNEEIELPGNLFAYRIN